MPQFDGEETGDKSPYMGKPCNAALILDSLYRQAAHDLYDSPKPYNYQGGNPDDLHEESEEDDGMDSSIGEKQKVSSEYA